MIADIVALDGRGRDALIVEVRTRTISAQYLPDYFARLADAGPFIPFEMVVDLEKIYLRRRSPGPSEEPAIELAAPDILTRYEPEFGSIRIFHDYLVALVDAWLCDLVFGWRNIDPPGLAELTRFGLVEHLVDGAVRREVPLGEDALR